MKKHPFPHISPHNAFGHPAVFEKANNKPGTITDTGRSPGFQDDHPNTAL